VQVVARGGVLLQEVELIRPTARSSSSCTRFNARRYRLDVSQAPLMRLVYARDPALDRVVGILLFHHLAMDHIALEVMRGEMQASLCGQLRWRRRCRIAITWRRRGWASASRNTRRFSASNWRTSTSRPAIRLQEVQGDGRGIDEAQQALPADDLSAFAHPGAAGRSQRGEPDSSGVGAGAGGDVRPAAVVFGTVLMGRMQGGEGATAPWACSSTACRCASTSMPGCSTLCAPPMRD
jgi:arthrofactin-type cyclic lipopeptide synthetase A